MKILKPGSRPYTSLGTICLFMLMLPLFKGGVSGRWDDAAKMAGMILGFFALLFTPMIFFRIEIDEQEIGIYTFGIKRKCVKFKDISYSEKNILVEKNWPTSLSIYGGNKELMNIGLKILKKEDMEWLISLPQLKIRN